MVKTGVQRLNESRDKSKYFETTDVVETITI